MRFGFGLISLLFSGNVWAEQQGDADLNAASESSESSESSEQKNEESGEPVLSSLPSVDRPVPVDLPPALPPHGSQVFDREVYLPDGRPSAPDAGPHVDAS